MRSLAHNLNAFPDHPRVPIRSLPTSPGLRRSLPVGISSSLDLLMPSLLGRGDIASSPKLSFAKIVIAESLSKDEIAGLKEMFKMIDADNSGQITFEELKAGLKRVGANLEESEIYDLMQAL